MNDEKHDLESKLLKMHEFYTAEARHQRSMMWETVKWFTPVMIALHTGWWYVFITEAFEKRTSEIQWCLIVLLSAGIALSFVCILLLRRFYRTNLIYITMFVKVEDELGVINRHAARTFFSEDSSITYRPYMEDREQYKTAENYVQEALKRLKSIYFLMALMFCLSILLFLVENFLLFFKVIGEGIMNTWLQILTIALALAGTYLLAFGLEIRSQYSKEIEEDLKLKDKDLIPITGIKQRKRLLYWGLALLTLAGIVQAFDLFIS